MNKSTSLVCRLCGCDNLSQILSLKDMPLTDNFLSRSNNKVFIEDIDIFQCNKCGLVQNPRDFDFESYYINYEYSS